MRKNPEMNHYVDDCRQSETEAELTAQISVELGNSSYRAVRRVGCEFRDGTLTLRGQVPSYFLKQIAQTIVRRGLHASVRIDNRVEVVYQT